MIKTDGAYFNLTELSLIEHSPDLAGSPKRVLEILRTGSLFPTLMENASLTAELSQEKLYEYRGTELWVHLAVADLVYELLGLEAYYPRTLIQHTLDEVEKKPFETMISAADYEENQARYFDITERMSSEDQYPNATLVIRILEYLQARQYNSIKSKYRSRRRRTKE